MCQLAQPYVTSLSIASTTIGVYEGLDPLFLIFYQEIKNVFLFVIL